MSTTQKSFTREEVNSILVSVLLFSGANSNQGLSSIKGANYGEQAETIILANESIKDTNKSLVSVISKFK